MYGQWDIALRNIRWGVDWLVKAHVTASDTPTANVFVGQVCVEQLGRTDRACKHTAGWWQLVSMLPSNCVCFDLQWCLLCCAGGAFAPVHTAHPKQSLHSPLPAPTIHRQQQHSHACCVTPMKCPRRALTQSDRMLYPVCAARLGRRSLLFWTPRAQPHAAPSVPPQLPDRWRRLCRLLCSSLCSQRSAVQRGW